MFGLGMPMLLMTLVAVLAGGGAIALLFRRFNTEDRRLTVGEFAACTAVLLVVLIPSVGWAGQAIASHGSVGGYKEFWNGSIVAAKSQEFTCERDGACSHTYDCDPYQELETYTDQEPYTATETYTDSQGRLQTRTVTKYRSVTKTRWVTKYHSCPYATHEYSYWLEDSLGGNEGQGDHVFASDAQEWRRGEHLPGDVARGVPARWLAVKASLDAGDAPPMTAMHDYTNYLLAAQDSVLSAYSDTIDTYRKAGLLPYHTVDLTTSPIKNGFIAEKAVLTGIDKAKVGNYDEWQQAVAQLNSYLGTQLQGDLHVLVVPAGRVDNPDDYANALLAYWQSRELDKLGLAKNAIMLVVGVSDDLKTVKWARGKTGIPEGNGEMLSALSQRLKDKPFEPKTLIGWPKARSENGKLVFAPSNGLVEQVLLRDYPFKRPCMDCKDAGDHGSGYVYLKSSAYIPHSTQYGIAAVVFVLGMATFAFAAWFNLGAAMSSFMAFAQETISDLRSRVQARKGK